MDHLTDIYDASTQEDLDDRDLAASGELLQKMASEEGIDLDTFSASDTADLLVMLQGGKVAGAQNNPEQGTTKEAAMDDDKTQDALTHADVARELAKIAQANNVDLTDVPRETLFEWYDNLAAQMQDPEYQAKVAEEQAKLAEADGLGRYMARSFWDEISKLAEDEKDEDKKEEKKEDKMPPFMKKKEEDKEEKKESSAMAGIRNLLVKRASAKSPDGDVEAEALKIAREYVASNGINPDTGEPLSKDEQFKVAAQERAAEILREKGYIK